MKKKIKINVNGLEILIDEDKIRDVISQNPDLVKPVRKEFHPILNERYYAISDVGVVVSSKWTSKDLDHWRLIQKNVFKNKEDAESKRISIFNLHQIYKYADEKNLLLSHKDIINPETEVWGIEYAENKFGAYSYKKDILFRKLDGFSNQIGTEMIIKKFTKELYQIFGMDKIKK